MRILWRPRTRPALALGLILLLVGILAIPAAAVEFRTGNAVTIGPGEVIDDDLFISASTVTMDGTVNGDLWVAGTQVTVNGTVNGSLFFAGQALMLGGKVAGSLYTVGSGVTLTPQGSVARNTYFAGFGLTADAGSRVGRDLLAAGNQARLDGEVARNASFAGSALDINGTIGNDVDARVGEPGAPAVMPPFTGPGTPAAAPSGIRVGPTARIGGRLTFRSTVDQSANIKSQPAGGVVFVPLQRPRVTAGELAARWALGWFREFVTLLALGGLAIWGLRAPIDALAVKVRDEGWLSVGWGILILLAGFAAAFVAGILILIVGLVLAALTLGGLAFTVLGAAGSAWALGFAIFLLAVVYGSKIVVSYLIGKLVLQRAAGLPNVAAIWILLVGVVIFSLLRSIPFFVGAAVDVAAALIGLGAIYLVFRDSQAAPRTPLGP